MIDRAIVPVYLDMRMMQGQFDIRTIQNQLMQERLNYLHSYNSHLYQDLINGAPICKNNKEIYNNDKEVKKLVKQINDIIEHEDEKQKILKITVPEVLKKDINADVVIVYGNVSGKIDAKNVVCVKDLTEKSDIKNKIVVPSEIEIEKLNYYKEHPDCYFCKFCEKGRDPCYYSTTYFCKIRDKNVRGYHKIRARLCKQYNPKENL